MQQLKVIWKKINIYIFAQYPFGFATNKVQMVNKTKSCLSFLNSFEAIKISKSST